MAYIYDYSLADQTVTIMDSDQYGNEIYGEFTFTFDTYTDYYWYNSGSHESGDREVPYLEFEDIQIGSVNYFDETGGRVSWGMDAEAVEELILGLLRENRERLESYLVEDY